GAGGAGAESDPRDVGGLGGLSGAAGGGDPGLVRLGAVAGGGLAGCCRGPAARVGGLGAALCAVWNPGFATVLTPHRSRGRGRSYVRSGTLGSPRSSPLTVLGAMDGAMCGQEP